MVSIQLTPRQVLEYVIVGIKNKNYQAAINIAQDCINQLDAQSETNQTLEPTAKGSADTKIERGGSV